MLECRQLVCRRDSIAVLHVHSTFIAPSARPRGGSHYGAVDVKRVADLYAQVDLADRCGAGRFVAESGGLGLPCDPITYVNLREAHGRWRQSRTFGSFRSDGWGRLGTSAVATVRAAVLWCSSPALGPTTTRNHGT
jgi:hypothetical protein